MYGMCVTEVLFCNLLVFFGTPCEAHAELNTPRTEAFLVQIPPVHLSPWGPLLNGWPITMFRPPLAYLVLSLRLPVPLFRVLVLLLTWETDRHHRRRDHHPGRVERWHNSCLDERHGN